MKRLLSIVVLLVAGMSATAYAAPDVNVTAAPNVNVTKVYRFYFGDGSDGPQGQQRNVNGPQMGRIDAFGGKWFLYDNDAKSRINAQIGCALDEYVFIQRHDQWHDSSHDYYTVICGTITP